MIQRQTDISPLRILKGLYDPAWQYTIKDILQLMQFCESSIQHCYREVNQVADEKKIRLS